MMAVPCFAVFLFCMYNAVNGYTFCGDLNYCQNDIIVEIDGFVRCWGTTSCLGANITIIDTDLADNYETVCAGTRSCQELVSLYISSSDDTTSFPRIAEMTGYLALAWTNLVIIEATGDGATDGSLSCDGEASCYGIKEIRDVYNLECLGTRSCDSIEAAYVTNDIYGYGMFSLMNGVFYSNNNDYSSNSLTTVSLYGYYAGYNATFVCQSGDKCNVICKFTGCVNFNYVCQDGAISCDLDCDESANHICPNTNIIDEIDLNLGNAYDMDGYDGSLVINMFKKIYSMNVTYENSVECADYRVIDNNTCDTDQYGGCEDSIFNDISGAFCCNAYESCQDSSITVVATTPNNGDDTGDTLYCNGEDSCGDTTLLIDNNNNNGYNIKCRGTHYRSRGLSEINNMDAMTVTANWGFTGDIKNGNYLGCYGYFSCLGGPTKNVSTVVGSGYQSLYENHFYSNGSDLNIFLLGYRAGYLMDVTCNGNDTCTIYALNDEYRSDSMPGSWIKCEELPCNNVNYVNINTSEMKQLNYLIIYYVVILFFVFFSFVVN